MCEGHLTVMGGGAFAIFAIFAIYPIFEKYRWQKWQEWQKMLKIHKIIYKIGHFIVLLLYLVQLTTNTIHVIAE